jgi:hypothetical protein
MRQRRSELRVWPVTRRKASLCHSTVVTMGYDGLVAGAMSSSCHSVGLTKLRCEVKPDAAPDGNTRLNIATENRTRGGQ